MFNKKGISPVVATSLLLVVAVLTVVYFQNWFTFFSSGIFANVETDSNIQNNNLLVEELIGKQLYIQNQGQELNILEININNEDCEINESISIGHKKINISKCIEKINSQTADIVIVTDKGIINSFQFIDSNYLNSNSSSNSTPPIDPFAGIPLTGNDCSYNSIDVTHRTQVEFFDSLTVPNGETCDSVMRICNNGTLTESFTET